MVGDVKALVDVAFGKVFGESGWLWAHVLSVTKSDWRKVRMRSTERRFPWPHDMMRVSHTRGHVNGFFVIGKVLAVPCLSHVCHWTGKESYMRVKNETDNKKLHLCIKRSLQYKLLKGPRRNVHMMKTFNSIVNINRTSEWECSLTNRNVSGVWSSLSLSRPIWRVGLEVCVRMRIFDSRQGTYLSLLPTQF